MRPKFCVDRSEDYERGRSVVTLWDTAHTEILDCWVIEDHDDLKKCREELEGIFL